MFYDETCAIYAPTLTLVDGEERSTLAAVETGVPCAFYGPGNSYAPGRFGQRQGTEAYTLVLPGHKASLAVKGRTVEINGDRYLVESVQVNRFPGGPADNAECRISQIENA
jgi:hypothetical protein